MVYGFRAFSRASDGSITLLSYHPLSCPTWHWSASLTRRQRYLKRLVSRTPKWARQGQWHDYVRLPFGWALCISRQDYHKPKARPVASTERA